MGYAILGLMLAMGGSLAAIGAGAGVLGAFLAYILGGSLMLLAVVAVALVTDDGKPDLHEDPLLLPGE